ncbi:MAG: ferrous iron transporter B [Oscillospiraceae bacterium]|nr:ferrous iron transporter B [Oscillospiraceae bacterium]
MEHTIALAGNPNVGKSTVFNALTGMRQHTGNWTGKTVQNARGKCVYNDEEYIMVDLPGTYSLRAHSYEEEIARDYIRSGEPDAVIVVCDATSLERNLYLALQILEITSRVLICVNLMDEAEKKKIRLDLEKLSALLGVTVCGVTARSGKGLDEMMSRLPEVINKPENSAAEAEKEISEIVKNAESIAKACVTFEKPDYYERDRRVDKIVTHRIWGVPVMLMLLTVVFWITLTGANYPSEALFSLFFKLEVKLSGAFAAAQAPAWLSGILIDGVYRVLAWVIAVMLPPMAIFFPLFTILEDLGYLPRVAFNLDKHFKKSGACGKQALTMCMGFGCNAAGITGCRIIDSPRERLIAVLTNNFVPCNGRFPTLIAVLAMFFAASFGVFRSLISAVMLTAIIILGVALTFLLSRILSKTLLKGIPSSFALELPPYRRPQIGKVIVRSIFDRTIFVLGRAICVAAPAGLVIWLFANISFGGQSLLNICADFLEPFAYFIGLDGVILLAFILGFPANEIVMPIMIMAYIGTGKLTDYESLDSLKTILTDNGWTMITAACVIIFTLCHSPCSTAVLTIKKETGGMKWALLSMLIPTAAGIILCAFTANLLRVFI